MFEHKTKSYCHRIEWEIINSAFKVFNLSLMFNEFNSSNQSKRQGGLA